MYMFDLKQNRNLISFIKDSKYEISWKSVGWSSLLSNANGLVERHNDASSLFTQLLREST